MDRRDRQHGHCADESGSADPGQLYAKRMVRVSRMERAGCGVLDWSAGLTEITRRGRRDRGATLNTETTEHTEEEQTQPRRPEDTKQNYSTGTEYAALVLLPPRRSRWPRPTRRPVVEGSCRAVSRESRLVDALKPRWNNVVPTRR